METACSTSAGSFKENSNLYSEQRTAVAPALMASRMRGLGCQVCGRNQCGCCSTDLDVIESDFSQLNYDHGYRDTCTAGKRCHFWSFVANPPKFQERIMVFAILRVQT